MNRAPPFLFRHLHSPCLHLTFDSTPSFCYLIGFVLVALELRAAVRVEPVELKPRLFGLTYLHLQRLEDSFLLTKLSLPLLKVRG